MEIGEGEVRPMERKELLVQNSNKARLKVLLLVVSDKELGSHLVQIIQRGTSSYCALLVENSQEALEVTRDITPDLLLLDYRLPEINGVMLYQHLQAVKGLREISALIINTPSFHENLLYGKRKVLYLTSPLEQDELLSSIEMVAAGL